MKDGVRPLGISYENDSKTKRSLQFEGAVDKNSTSNKKKSKMLDPYRVER